jgi:hypothetical protein
MLLWIEVTVDDSHLSSSWSPFSAAALSYRHHWIGSATAWRGGTDPYAPDGGGRKLSTRFRRHGCVRRGRRCSHRGAGSKQWSRQPAAAIHGRRCKRTSALHRTAAAKATREWCREIAADCSRRCSDEQCCPDRCCERCCPWECNGVGGCTSNDSGTRAAEPARNFDNRGDHSKCGGSCPCNAATATCLR